MKKDWKSTIFGILTLALVGVNIAGQARQTNTLDALSKFGANNAQLAAVATGLGLIFAADSKKDPGSDATPADPVETPKE